MRASMVALSWELWRRNRWGVAALLILLASGLAARSFVGHYQAKVVRLQAEVTASEYHGSLGPRDVLQRNGSRYIEREMKFWFGGRMFDVGTFTANDELTWTIHGTTDTYFLVAARIHGTNIVHDLLVPYLDVIRWTEAKGHKQRETPWAPQELIDRVNEADAAGNAVGEWRGPAMWWAILMYGCSVLALFNIFGLAEPHAARGFTGMPPRWFTLPVGTRALVAVPVVWGAACMAALWLGWTCLVFRPLTAPGPMWTRIYLPELYLAALALAGLSVFQAVTWGLALFTKTRIALLTLLLMVMVAFAWAPFERVTGVDATAEPSWIVWEPRLVALLAGVWIGGMGAAFVGVRWERRGRWQSGRPGGTSWLPWRELAPQWVAFRSPFQAQLWMEWRRNFRWSFLAAVVLAGMFAGASLLAAVSAKYSPLVELLRAWAVIGGAGWVIITGLNVARDGSSKQLALSSFTATRPLGTGTLLQIKLLAGLGTWAFGVAIAAGTALLVVATASEAHALQSYPPALWILALALSLQVFVGILPVSLSGRIPGFPWTFLIMVGICAGAVDVWQFILKHHFEELAAVALAGLVVIKLALAFVGFRRSLARRLISPGFVGAYVVGWLLASGLLALWARIQMERLEWEFIGISLVMLAWLALPLARVAFAPVALAGNRHR